MKTIDWPPNFTDGRMEWVSGAAASRVLIMQTLGDLTQNPFNPKNICLGNVTFRTMRSARSRVQVALKRVASIVAVQTVSETDTHDGTKVITVQFIDRETRERGSLTING